MEAGQMSPPSKSSKSPPELTSSSTSGDATCSDTEVAHATSPVATKCDLLSATADKNESTFLVPAVPVVSDKKKSNKKCNQGREVTATKMGPGELTESRRREILKELDLRRPYPTTLQPVGLGHESWRKNDPKYAHTLPGNPHGNEPLPYMAELTLGAGLKGGYEPLRPVIATYIKYCKAKNMKPEEDLVEDFCIGNISYIIN